MDDVNVTRDYERPLTLDGALNVIDALRARVKDLETTLHDAIVHEQEAEARADAADVIVQQVPDGLPGEIDVISDGHSHHYVPSAALGTPGKNALLRASLALADAESARLRFLGEQLEQQQAETEERAEGYKRELDEMASRFRQAAREVDRVLKVDRAVREALARLGDARPAARWVVTHADRAHEYDRPHAKDALDHLLAAEAILKETQR